MDNDSNLRRASHTKQPPWWLARLPRCCPGGTAAWLEGSPLHREGACACVPCPVFTQQEIGLQKSGKWVGSVPERHPAEPAGQASCDVVRTLLSLSSGTWVHLLDHSGVLWPSKPPQVLSSWFSPRRLAGAAYREVYAPLERRKIRLEQVRPKVWSWWTPQSR